MVNTYYTRSGSRFKAAPRARGAAKNLARGVRRERAAEALAAAERGEAPRGMGYYSWEECHEQWLVVAGFSGPLPPRLWGMEVSDGPDV